MEVVLQFRDDIVSRSLGYFTAYKNSLAIIGSAITAYKLIQLSWDAIQAARLYAFSRFHRLNLVQKYGSWAVITGASEGVGRAFTIELAKQGVNVVIISRSKSRLYELEKLLKEMHGVKVKVVVADLSGGPEVYDSIRQQILGDPDVDEIGILINNVGVMYDYPEYFLNVDKKKLWDLINVNMAATTMMTHLLLPQMVDRKKGAIINMSSTAGVKPGPLVSVYAATKTYVDYFSQALAYEYKQQGIVIQTLLPSYIATKMVQYNSLLSTPSIISPSPSVYVKSALRTLGKASRTTGYWAHDIQYWCVHCLPDSWWLPSFSLINKLLRWNHKTKKQN